MFEKEKAPFEYKQDAYVFRQWLLLASGAENKELSEAKRNMGKAIRHCLTKAQLECITAYYVEGLKMRQIAERRGCDRSTVSRTLKRARHRLRMVLMYSGPLLLKATVDGLEDENE